MTKTAILLLTLTAAANANPILTFATVSDSPYTFRLTSGADDLVIDVATFTLQNPANDVSLSWAGIDTERIDCDTLCAFNETPLPFSLAAWSTGDLVMNGNIGAVMLDLLQVSDITTQQTLFVRPSSPETPGTTTPEPGSALMLLSGVVLFSIGGLRNHREKKAR